MHDLLAHILFDYCPGLHRIPECNKRIRSVVEIAWGSLVFIFLIFAIGFVVELGLVTYQSVERSGYIPHSHDTPVWIQGDWLVGEYRDCGMLTTTPPAGVVLSQTARAELPRLFCGKNWEGEGVAEFEIAMPDPDSATNALRGRSDWSAFEIYFHVLPVQYFGRIERPDSWFISWRCQRKSDSLTCKALN